MRRLTLQVQTPEQVVQVRFFVRFFVTLLEWVVVFGTFKLFGYAFDRLIAQSVERLARMGIHSDLGK